MKATANRIPMVEKEMIPFFHFSHNDVLENTEAQKRRMWDLNRASMLGNGYRGKVEITYNEFRVCDFRLTNFEMETAGYYGMGRLLGHEVLSLNAIVANRVTQEFAKNAYDIVDDLIVKVLDRI